MVTGRPAAGSAGERLTLDRIQGPIDPNWRIYGRSSSDDKAPILAFLAAIDALEASNIPLTSNVRVILEGDEEAGSPSLELVVRQHGDRIRGDALLLVDGPRHASDRPTLSFGARGIMTAIVTVYGQARDLHSGNNQRGSNENVRIRNLWEGLESMAALLTMP